MLSFTDRKDRSDKETAGATTTIRNTANRLQCAGKIDAAAHIYGIMCCAAEIAARSEIVSEFAADYAQLLEICCKHDLAVRILRRAIDMSMSGTIAEVENICGEIATLKNVKGGVQVNSDDRTTLPTEKYLCHLLLLKLLYCRPQALDNESLAEIQHLTSYLEKVHQALTRSGVDTKHGVFKSHWSYFHIVRGLMCRERRLNSCLQLRVENTRQHGNAIYCVGDSHVVSMGHRIIRNHIDGKEMITVPWVITGLKAWHVHLGDSYFTGANLKRALQLIAARWPRDGETDKRLNVKSMGYAIECIISAGEIDVREGIVNAVESHKYRDSAEAVRVTCESYINGLKDMVCEVDPAGVLKLHIFPVLPHCRRRGKAGKYRNRQCRRNLQRMWNDELKKLLIKDSEAHPRFSFLDLANKVEETTGPFMRPELCLDDGTHANARIMETLQQFLPPV